MDIVGNSSHTTYTCSFCYQQGHRYTQCVDPSAVELVQTMDNVYLINYAFLAENWYVRRQLRELSLSSLKMLAHRHAISIAPSKRQNAAYHVQRLLDTVYYINEGTPSSETKRAFTAEMIAKFRALPIEEVEGHMTKIGEYWPNMYYRVYEHLYTVLRPMYKFPMVVVQIDKTSSFKTGLPTQYLSVVPKYGNVATDQDQGQCTVCLEDFKEDTAVHFNCTHTFCYSCVDQYFTHVSGKEDRTPKCPTCRSTVRVVMSGSNHNVRRLQCKFVSSSQSEDTKTRIYDQLAKCRREIADERRVQADLERCRRLIATQRAERTYWEQCLAPYGIAWTAPYLIQLTNHIPVWFAFCAFIIGVGGICIMGANNV